jgi:hypothetical protein
MLYKLGKSARTFDSIDPLPFSGLPSEKGLEVLLAQNLWDVLFEASQLMPIFQERPWQPEADIYALNEYGDLVIFECDGSVDESCTSYQQVGSEKPLGSDEPLIILFSTVAALEVDCSFKTKRNELNELARMNGFKLADFLPNGRFSDRMREKTSSMRGIIKEKGCKVVHEMVRRSFPTVSR